MEPMTVAEVGGTVPGATLERAGGPGNS
jgi:hypothetical protein